jgi:copper chaperone
MTTKYKIEGMTCNGCVRSVTNALESANATEVLVDLASKTVEVGTLGEDVVKQVIEDAGFDFGGRV